MERVKSIFRRDSQRSRPRRPSDLDPWAPGTSSPNGVAVEHPLHSHPVQSGAPLFHQQNGTQPIQQQQHAAQPVHQHHHAAQPVHQHQHQHQHSAQPGDGTGPAVPTTAATQSGILQIQLVNDSNSSDVYAYITGDAINNGNALFLLGADGHTPYYPASPSVTGQRLQQNVSIHLGSPGSSVYCTIPFLAGARIWFSIGAPLVFAVNPGPGLVEPSIFNHSDPNINTNFGFAEFTFNNSQVFANLSYVDFVGPSISMTLEDTSRQIQHVSGMHADGLQFIASGLRQQTAKDGAKWSSLIINGKSGQLLRILSPNSGILLNPSWFSGYYTNYVNQVYGMFTNQTLSVDTQAQWGNVSGRSNGSGINFGSGGDFVKPSAGDIFSCASGPFATGANGETNTIIPRLSAAFNRSTMLLTDNQPDGVGPAQYYQNPTTNHYARIVHAANLDGHGYAFPYDDVTPDGGVPQEGAVFSYSPARLTVAVGGLHAHV